MYYDNIWFAIANQQNVNYFWLLGNQFSLETACYFSKILFLSYNLKAFQYGATKSMQDIHYRKASQAIEDKKKSEYYWLLGNQIFLGNGPFFVIKFCILHHNLKAFQLRVAKVIGPCRLLNLSRMHIFLVARQPTFPRKCAILPRSFTSF